MYTINSYGSSYIAHVVQKTQTKWDLNQYRGCLGVIIFLFSVICTHLEGVISLIVHIVYKRTWIVSNCIVKWEDYNKDQSMG